jgi:hypothetical protein
MISDSDLYTGVDGVFGNETKNEEVEEQKREQKDMIAKLLPKLEDLLALIDAEITQATSIDRFLVATDKPEVDIRAELQATALYKKYLEGLKTKFVLAMREAKGK